MDSPNYEKEFFDEIFINISKLDYSLLKTRYFLELSVFTKSEEDSTKIRIYYELAKKSTEDGTLSGFGLYGNKKRRWVEVAVEPQIFIDFYTKRVSSPVTQTQVNNSSLQFEGYDVESYVLKLTGTKIKMAKKGKDNDGTLLLKSLLKKEPAGWKYDDEVFEDWGYNLADLKDKHRNKIYFAAKNINDCIAKDIQIKDFIERKGAETRINPKYRKIS